MGDGAEKVVTFLNNISQTKTSVWGLNRACYHCLRPQKRGVDKKPSKHAYIREKVKGNNKKASSIVIHIF
jgi:hypothetical protein